MLKKWKNEQIWHKFQIIQVICQNDQENKCNLIMMFTKCFDQPFLYMISYMHNMPHIIRGGCFLPHRQIHRRTLITPHHAYNSSTLHYLIMHTWCALHGYNLSIECSSFGVFLLSIDHDPEVDPAFYDSYISISDEQGKHNLMFEPMFPKALCSFAFHTVQLSFGS